MTPSTLLVRCTMLGAQPGAQHRHGTAGPPTQVALFNGMLHHVIWEGWLDHTHIAQHTEGFEAVKHMVRDMTPAAAAALCGISESDLCQAAEWFARSPAALSLYCMGMNQSSHGTDKNLALINLHLATGQIGRPGLAAVDMFDALAEGKVKAVWIACTNPAHSLPRIEAVRQALRQAELVVVQEAFADTDTVAFADVLLPAATWGEKEGTVTNSERRISRVRAAVPPPGNALPDWRIATEIGRRLQRLVKPQAPDLFPYETPREIFDEHRALTKGRDHDIGGLSYEVLQALGPQQWPFPEHSKRGQARRYTDGCYATESGRARFQAVTYRPVASPTTARHPFHLITGRLRDQWHGMSRTGRIAQAFAHAPEPSLDMHPDDARRRGLAAGDLVRVESRDGTLVLPLRLSDDLTPGTVFAAMHWNGQFLGSGGINEVCNAAVDRRSLQPELKHSAIRIEKMALNWRVRAAVEVDGQADAIDRRATLQPMLAACGFGALGLRGDAHRTVLTLSAAMAEPDQAWLRALGEALEMIAAPDVLEYRDRQRGIYKSVRWHGDRLRAFLLAGEVGQADALLERLVAGVRWEGSRLRVFTPASLPATRDRTVCQCTGIKASAIETAIAQGADVAGLKAALGCGTVCGACVPELTRMCSESRLPA
ncbi:MAG: molybdopterin-dependent oxidoreductase [Pigmentiphaga sp.]|nr:molybdopterin-dependent oxidoreductase [Pigmentiphaga sp.]